MTRAEFVSALIAAAKARHVDAGPYAGRAEDDPYPPALEIYEHAVDDDIHDTKGVYIWDDGCSHPIHIPDDAFDLVMVRVNALPLDLSELPPASGDMGEDPGDAERFWRVVTTP